ncbi:MAG: hypothetical protein M0R76_00355 [Proteobacteria bacterium]|nr:hypothetical protein [Pseudomonadota bacterium]
MQFIIVASDDLAPLGRQLAHALSVQKTHSGAFWTVKHYKDNEAQLDGKQPVVFLGDNEVAKSYVDVLPERFRGFGTKCSFEGAKAVLIADEPDDVSHEDIASLKRAVEGNQEELRRRAASAAAASATGAVGAMGASAVASAIGVVLWAPVLVGVVAYLVHRFMSARKRKQEYRKLQYEYALSRFLKDEFEAYVSGVEGRG